MATSRDTFCVVVEDFAAWTVRGMANAEDDIEDIDIDLVSDITEIKRLYSLLQQKEVGLY